MDRSILLLCFLSYCLSRAESFSFFSHVLYRMMFFPSPIQRQQITNGHMGKVQEGPKRITKDTAVREVVIGVAQGICSSANHILPNEFDLPSISYPLSIVGTLHMTEGKVTGIQSLETPIINIGTDSNGNWELTIETHFSDLVVVYDDIFIDFIGREFDKRRSGQLQFLSNKFIAQVRVVKTSKIFMNMQAHDCILYVRSVKICDLGDVNVDIFNDKNLKKAFTSAVVSVLITTIEKTISEQVSLAMNEYLSDNLPEGKALVCRDPSLQHERIDHQATKA